MRYSVRRDSQQVRIACGTNSKINLMITISPSSMTTQAFPILLSVGRDAKVHKCVSHMVSDQFKTKRLLLYCCCAVSKAIISTNASVFLIPTWVYRHDEYDVCLFFPFWLHPISPPPPSPSPFIILFWMFVCVKNNRNK